MKACTVLARIIDDGRLAGSVIHQNVDDPHLVKIFCAHDLAAKDQLLGHLPADTAQQKAVGAHAGKQVEHDFGKTKSGAALGHQHVERQGMFESAAQGVSLHQRHGDDRRAETRRMGILHAHAGLRIGPHRRQITRHDLFRKMPKIAAKVENARCFGRADEIAQIVRRPLVYEGRPALHPVVHLLDLGPQRIGVAGPAFLVHVTPENTVLDIVTQRNLFEVTQENVRVHLGNAARRVIIGYVRMQNHSAYPLRSAKHNRPPLPAPAS